MGISDVLSESLVYGYFSFGISLFGFNFLIVKVTASKSQNIKHFK